MTKQKRQIGTSEFIVVHGAVEDPEAVFYVKEFEGGKIRTPHEGQKTADGWSFPPENKSFSQKYIETLFMD